MTKKDRGAAAFAGRGADAAVHSAYAGARSDTVFSKAIRPCMECVGHWRKQKLSPCPPGAFILAGATLPSNIHLPNLQRSVVSGQRKIFVCVPGLNRYSCPGAAAPAWWDIPGGGGLFRFRFSYYITILNPQRQPICGFPLPIRGFQELLHKIPSPASTKLCCRYLKYKRWSWCAALLLEPGMGDPSSAVHSACRAC